MENGQESYPGFGKEAPIQSIQPGSGWGMRLELAWGRWRHWVLSTFFPKYIAEQNKHRQGSCANCPGRSLGCSGNIIDSRDLKYFSNVCGYSFSLDQDQFAWRGKLPFARWGLSELIAFTVVCTIASVIVGWLAWFGAPSWLVWILSIAIFLFWLEIVWFFRNPARSIPADASAIVSPADGTIVELTEVDAEGFPGNRAFRVGIFLSVFNVHINRAPLTGVVTQLRFYPGKFLNALKTLSSRVNEQLWIDMKHDGTGMPVRITQISGALAHRIVCELKPGQHINKGEMFGMIKLGSRTELYLPTTAKIELNVKVGDKVKGGSTILMRLTPSVASHG